MSGEKAAPRPGTLGREKFKGAVGGQGRAMKRADLAQPLSAQSRLGLDWMHFFIANVQISVGTLVAF
jgi:hypothetical protein